MLVEHTFITTMDSETALARAAEILDACGFTICEQESGRMMAERGRQSPSAARTVHELPQRVRLDYDRGRITLALLARANRKPGPLLSEMLLTLARAVEQYVGGGLSQAEARCDWEDLSARIEAARSREVRNRMLLLLIVAGVIIALLNIICFK
jgi:hypothetical protein